jgi:hypothetical protein
MNELKTVALIVLGMGTVLILFSLQNVLVPLENSGFGLLQKCMICLGIIFILTGIYIYFKAKD